jgi:hypothetical protein
MRRAAVRLLVPARLLPHLPVLAGQGAPAPGRWGKRVCSPVAWRLVIAVVHLGVFFFISLGEIVMRKERNSSWLR